MYKILGTLSLKYKTTRREAETILGLEHKQTSFFTFLLVLGCITPESRAKVSMREVDNHLNKWALQKKKTRTFTSEGKVFKKKIKY